MASELRVPTVTQDDLYAFHVRVFGLTNTSQATFEAGSSESGDGYELGFQQDEHELGYYPDGTKRTLTNEQIAMFRHSEVYSILRERQIRKENMEAEEGEEHEHDAAGTEGVAGARASPEIQDEPAQKEQTKPKKPHSISTFGTEHSEMSAAARKRRRHDVDRENDNRAHPSRRYVRELDSITTDDQVLDYGDEPTAAEMPLVAGLGPSISANKAMGRKIWWPVLDAS